MMRPATRLAAQALVTTTALAGCTAATPRAPAPARSAVPSPSPTAAIDAPAFAAALDGLEQRYDVRIGAAAIDTGTGARLTHRVDERFAFASAGKVFIAAETLRTASDADLDEVVRYSRQDVLAYAPITERHVATGMTVRALLDAMLRYSDNTAANLLVARIGGPDAVQRLLRAIDDPTTSVDRVEPDLNGAVPGDRRDTTTPAAYVRDLEEVLLGDVLREPRRALLEATMRANTTGDALVRAGVPSSWGVADKTGSASFGVRNDIAVLRPPGRAPIVLVLLTARSEQDAAPQDASVAGATKAVVDALEGRR